MKVLVNIWIYFWAYTFIISGLIGKGLDRIGDGINRLLDQESGERRESAGRTDQDLHGPEERSQKQAGITEELPGCIPQW